MSFKINEGVQQSDAFVDPSFMITQLRERQSEINQINQDHSDPANTAESNKDADYKKIQTSQTDPFMLLKEVVQMSKYMNPSAAGGIDSMNSGCKTDEF